MTTIDTVNEAQAVEVLVLGAGICGIAVAIGLRKAGIDDVVIVERSDSVGGTWHHNTYPGCAVDIPSHLYSFSFAPKPDWSRVYGTQAELEAYIATVVDDFGVRDNVRIETEVLEARWDTGDHRWHVVTNRGAFRARFFVIAAGPLHEPVIPALPGRDTFQGTAFHSSQWPEDIDVIGRAVVAIGTGASAIQFVPAIQSRVRRLTLVQRTPSWVLPKPDWDITETSKRCLARVPILMKLLRLFTWLILDIFTSAALHSPRIARMVGIFGRLHIRRHINDPSTRKALTPRYAPACKRLCFSNDYYRALAQPNVDLVTSPAVEVREHSVVTSDGREIPADIIIYGTGFHTLQHHPVTERVRGRSGETLAQVWRGNPKAHMGTTISGFPNAFMMFGPNVGTLSGFTMAEAQTHYIVGAIEAVRRLGVVAFDVTANAQDAFVAEADRTLNKSTFALGGCDSYYLADGHRRVSLPWPGTMYSLTRRLRKFDLESYQLIGQR
ncbi:NAD(P)/FAD-dependent oxidoreductase [Mycobacterium sp.]|uniref:flavin-containing monooxygenase n=1 Tax=Mycobacterium sp. TaxID=1785 RepID=UPI0012245D9B|nr:NAD(P)/FAD-dependent oxidoreductase [Mycobacterium sp.]TAM65066.1 MAG: NAD(P)/FAD-dependent oxidoreductase [Mycobacterium sp.]